MHTLSEQTISVQLPPHSYASYLLGQFETFIGSDYYWFPKRRFRTKMDSIYHSSRLQPADRMWLTCFSVVMALGESYSDNSAPAFTISNSDGVISGALESAGSTQTVPPGFEFFRQALVLVQFPYEEPNLEQVEALNLIVCSCPRMPYIHSSLTVIDILLVFAKQTKDGVHICRNGDSRRKTSWPFETALAIYRA